MTLREIVQKYPDDPDVYYELLDKIWHPKKNYLIYATSNPPDVTKELKRVGNADFDLACALLMMILREDHFCDTFDERYENGDVKKVVDRIAETL